MASRNELIFLQKYSEKKLKITKNKEKSYLNIRENILDTTFKKAKTLTETSLSCYTKVNSPFDMSYSYQRYDLSVNEAKWLSFLYNYEKINNKTEGLFLTSGMASINLIITVLNKLKIDSNIITTKGLYFETKILINRFFEYFKIEEIEGKKYANDGILLLDSSSENFIDVDYKKNHKIVMIDTSCFDPSSEVLKNFILKFCENSFVILLRSHIKLDCFGLEISRLGSVVFVYPKNNEENFKIGESIVNEAKELIKINGGNFEVKNIYSWLGNKEFFKLTKIRTNKIMNFCIKAENYLKDRVDSARYKILTADHKMYFYIKFLFKSDGKYEKFYDYGDYLSIKAQKLGLPVRNSCSFGLNLITFDKFDDDFDFGNQYLRISSADLSEKYVKPLCDFLLNELEDYGKS